MDEKKQVDNLKRHLEEEHQLLEAREGVVHSEEFTMYGPEKASTGAGNTFINNITGSNASTTATRRRALEPSAPAP